MSYNPSPNVTPFIPPLPSPGGNLVIPPVVPADPPIPNPQVNNVPSWATEPQTASNFPTMYPGPSQYAPYTPHTPFTGTPFIPRMDDLNGPALASALPGSYFPPPRSLPPQTPRHGADGLSADYPRNGVNGLSADYTGYPAGSQGPGGQGGGGGGGGAPQNGPQGFGGGGQGFNGGPQGFGGGGQGFNGGPQGFGGGQGFNGGPHGYGPQGYGPPPWAGPPMPGAYPYTPYVHPGMMPPHTGYMPFQQLPGAPWGPPAGFGPQQHTPGFGMTGMPGGMGHTPWRGGGGLPPGGPPQRPGFVERAEAKLSEHWHRSDGWDLQDQDKFRFTPGSYYGPVLDPFLLQVVRARIRINPLLEPPDDGLKRPHIEWNMLFPTSTCHRSTDGRGRSWIGGRDEPATFPRVTSLRLVCRNLPWMMTVRARNPSVGVTCGEVIDDINDYLYRHVSKKEMDGARNHRAINQTYWYNRSTGPDVPGGRLGDGVRRVDWLLRHTAFGGIEKNDDVARVQCGGEVLPCTFELRCEQKFAPDEELQEQDSPVQGDRSGRGSSFGPRSRTISRSRSRSRASPIPRVTIIE